MVEKEGRLEKKIREDMARFEDDFDYRAEGYFLDITEQVLAQMEREDISKVELSRRMNCSKSYITQLFKGVTNITLSTLAKLAIAVDAEWELTLLPESKDYLERVNTESSDKETASEAAEGWVFPTFEEKLEKKQEVVLKVDTGTESATSAQPIPLN